MSGAPAVHTGRSGRAARIIVLLVLLAMVGGAVVLERREPDVAPPRATAASADGVSVPSVDAVSTAWYCAAGTSNSGGAADETVSIGNLTPHAIRATVTVDPGGTDAPHTRDVRLDGYQQARVRVSEVLATASPGVVVEVFGGPAVVEHDLRGNNDLAMGACAVQPSRSWHFAAGTTAKGTAENLELFNPFGDDAIVDITFLTDAGVQAPQQVQGFVVSRRSKVTVPVTDLVPRQDRVATIVQARTGRIVAEQTQTFDGSTGVTGLAVSLGAFGPRRDWTLPFGEGGAGIGSNVAIANESLAPAEVQVSVALPGEEVLSPQTVTVPSRAVVNVDPGSTIGAGTGFAVLVRPKGSARVVAEAAMSEGAGAAARGSATAGGSAAPARRWALSGYPAATSAVITAVNRGSKPVTVEVRAYTAGDPNSPKSSPAAAVAPGRMVRFDLSELGIDPDQVLVVAANGPIVVGREVSTPGLSLSLAVPFRG